MYKQQAKSSHMELCRWIMHGAVARIQTTGMPPWGDWGLEALSGGEGHGMHTTQPPPTHPARHRDKEG